MSPILKIRPRRLLAALLLLVYGSTGILGYGLHSLWHLEHDHSAHTGAVVHSHGHSHGHCSAHVTVSSCCGSHLASHKAARVSSVNGDCFVCDFLAQAQTPVFEFSFSQIIAELGSEMPVSEEISPLPISAVHLARGPPLC